MKTTSIKKLFVAILIVLFVLPATSVYADPPRWAPAHGYRAKTRHIYFPDQNFYFDLQRNVYFYPNNGRWVSSVRLPSLYANINLMLAPQIQLDIVSGDPYRYNKVHVTKYKVVKPKMVKIKKAHPAKKKYKNK